MVFRLFLCSFHCNCKCSVARVILAETSNLYEDVDMSAHTWPWFNLWICCATMYCIDVLFNMKKEMKHGNIINVRLVSNALIGISKNCVIEFHFHLRNVFKNTKCNPVNSAAPINSCIHTPQVLQKKFQFTCFLTLNINSVSLSEMHKNTGDRCKYFFFTLMPSVS